MHRQPDILSIAPDMVGQPDGHRGGARRAPLAQAVMRVLSQVSLQAICDMISLHDQRYNMRERDMASSFKGAHFPPEVMLMGVRWYVAYPLSTRHVEALLEERGVHGDHSTLNRWVIKYRPQLEEAFHRRKRPVWVSWRMDETYVACE